MGVQEKRKSHLMLPELQNLLLSAIAIILSLFITAAIMLASGYHPIEAFRALLDGAFGSRNSMATTLGKTIPLVFVGLACAYSVSYTHLDVYKRQLSDYYNIMKSIFQRDLFIALHIRRIGRPQCLSLIHISSWDRASTS